MKNCCQVVFYNNIESFDIHFLRNFLKSCTYKTEKNKLATITTFPWSACLSNKALHQSLHKKSLSYCKMNISHHYDYHL